MLRLFLYIGIGGFLGSVARYYLAGLVQVRFLSNWPFGTFAVNIIGCFLIGIIFILAERTIISAEWRLFLSTGLCGGLTTFSSFSLEMLNLMRNGQFLYALSYAALSLLLGLIAVWAGLTLGRILV